MADVMIDMRLRILGSLLPEVSIIEPRYVNWLTHATVSDPTTIEGEQQQLCASLRDSITVFFQFTWGPSLDDSAEKVSNAAGSSNSKSSARSATFAVIAIGVASYGALGHVPPLDFQLFNFSGHFRAAQTLALDSMWLSIQQKPV